MQFLSESIIGVGITYVAGLISGVFLFLLYKERNGQRKTLIEELSDEGSECSGGSLGELKMVLVVRNDLKMGKGKAAAQCSHAAVKAYELARLNSPSLLNEWVKNGQRKIVVKVDSEAEMLKLADNAKKAGLISAVIRDAGKTQIPSGTRTVLAIGPGLETLVDEVSGHLKLY